jgi:fibronectin type 3 domain-containing protein
VNCKALTLAALCCASLACAKQAVTGDAPPAPTGLTAVANDGTVLLTWTSATSTVLYDVKRALQGGGPYALVGASSQTAFQDLGLVDDTDYYYVVSATNASGESANSGEVKARPVAAPPAPTGLTAAASTGLVALTWSQSHAAASYQVLRSATSTGGFTALGSATSTAFTDTTVTNGKTYWYEVSASNGTGASGPSQPAAATPIAPPTQLTAVGTSAQVSLSWTGSAGAASYNVKRAAKSGGPYALAGNTSQYHFTDTGLSNGTAYYYVVTAVLGAEETAPSNEVPATPAAGLPALPPDDPTKNAVGLGTWFVNDWDGSFAFADAIKQSRHWMDAAWKNDAPADALGWPTSDASTVILTADPAHANGTYKLLMNGQATIAIAWVPGSVANQVYDSGSNTTTADVTLSLTGTTAQSVRLVLTNTKRTAASAAGTGVTNVRLYRPGYAPNGPVYTAPFLAVMGKATVTRMMDWQGGNAATLQHWADRSTPAHASQVELQTPPYTGPDGTVYNGPRGVAVEHQIQLCNALHNDCWFNLSATADDAYVRNLALALRYGTDGVNPYTSDQASPVYPPLDPVLRIYLEYANEIWNSAGGFQSFPVIKGIVGALPAGHPLLSPDDPGIYGRMWRWPAFRMAQISDLFRSVYGDASMNTRVRPVVMTQQGNGQATLSSALTWLASYAAAQGKKPSDYLYAAGGSGYYGGAEMSNPDPDTFFAAYPNAGFAAAVAVDAAWSMNYGLRHVAYEGGPSFDPFSDTANITLDTDARMQVMVASVHDVWSQAGGDLLTYYMGWGSPKWAFTPDILVSDSPKLKALGQLQSQPRVKVTAGAALPGSIAPGSAPQVATDSTYNTTVGSKSCIAGGRYSNAGSFDGYGAHADAGFSGTISLTGGSSGGAAVDVYVNGVKAGTATFTKGSGLLTSSGVAAAIPQGLVVIRLVTASGSYALCSVDVK